jgi:hypothetical protein
MTCTRDGCERRRFTRGLCHTCYYAARAAGTLPPPLLSNSPTQQDAAGRREDYADLRGWGLSVNQAAERLGVCLRTAERYESHRKTNSGRAAA